MSVDDWVERSLWNTVQLNRLQNVGAFLPDGSRSFVRIIEFPDPFVLEIHGRFLQMQKNQKMRESSLANISRAIDDDI